MSAHVVDTNVLVAGNERSGATPECVEAAQQRLRRIERSGTVVVDSTYEILREYERNCRPRKQPGIGDLFLQWVHRNQANPHRCERVHITPGEEPHEYDEFPDDPALATFHKKDRKFVAVAISSELSPVIVNATDRGWWEHREALRRNGITVEFVHPGEFA